MAAAVQTHMVINGQYNGQNRTVHKHPHIINHHIVF